MLRCLNPLHIWGINPSLDAWLAKALFYSSGCLFYSVDHWLHHVEVVILACCNPAHVVLTSLLWLAIIANRTLPQASRTQALL